MLFLAIAARSFVNPDLIRRPAGIRTGPGMVSPNGSEHPIGKRKCLLRSEVKKYKPEVGGRPRKTPAKKTAKRTTRR